MLVYEPRNGRLQLVAVEYITPAAAWDPVHDLRQAARDGPPVSFRARPQSLRPGCVLRAARLGVEGQPARSFADWNPKVSCADWEGTAFWYSCPGRRSGERGRLRNRSCDPNGNFHSGTLPGRLPARRKGCSSRGQPFKGEHERVELLVVPEPGEVQAQRARQRSPRRRRSRQSASVRRARRRSRSRARRHPRRERPRAASTTPVSSIDEGTPRLPPHPPSAFCASSSHATARRRQSVARGSRCDQRRMQAEKDASRSVRGIVLVGRVLVAEPERDPCAVRSLRGGQEPHGSPGSRSHVALQRRIEVRLPDAPRLQRVRRDLRSAPIEWKRPPAAAERRDAAVAVLNPQQPADACAPRRPPSADPDRQVARNARSAPDVSSASGTPPLNGVHAHAPGAAWVNGCSRVLCWPSSHSRIAAISPRRQRAGLRERPDRQRRHPGREVGVDRPAAVVAHRVDEEPHARFHDRTAGLSHRRPGSSPRSWSAAWLRGSRRSRVAWRAAGDASRRERRPLSARASGLRDGAK